MSIADKQRNFIEDLAIFPDWSERYEYIISLGKSLTPMGESSKIDDNLIKGCQALVWLDGKYEDGKVIYSADSNSQITKGLAAVFVRILSGESPEEILTADMSFVTEAGLRDHFIGTRANALTLMANQMKQRALEFASL